MITGNGLELAEQARSLYSLYGQRKPMGESSPRVSEPHYFLLRTFMNENDLLVIFNTKRCRYQCYFCQLPAKSSHTEIRGDDIVSQFEYVISETKHALSILDRVTLSNDGSVLDETTFSPDALRAIFAAINELRRVRTIVLETRLEFIDVDRLQAFKALVPRVNLNLLTGFETLDERLRDKVLGKREPLTMFLAGLDKVQEVGADLTAYVLFKPDPEMSDAAAYAEADRSIAFLSAQCSERSVDVTVRINPMYLANGSRWARYAEASDAYIPPRLTDVMRLAENWRDRGVAIYIGLSTEGLADDGGSYLVREDYDPSLIRLVKLFNDRKLSYFPVGTYETRRVSG